MKLQIRWWDGLALLASVIAAVLILQYVLSRGGLEKLPVVAGNLPGAVAVELRVPRPLPEIAEQILPGDPVQDASGQILGRVLAKRAVNPTGQYSFGRMAGEADVLVSLRLEKELPAARDIPGLPHSLASMRPGIWCVLITPHVEVAGLVVRQAAVSAREKPRE